MHNKKTKHRRLKKPVKLTLILSSILLTLSLSVGVTYAFLFTRTNEVVNVFTATTVNNEIKEDFKNDLKQNVVIANTGDINAFVRATIVITWQNEAGEVYPVLPVEDTDYTITMYDDNSWFTANGIYYCATEIVPGSSTPVLIKECSPVTGRTPKGYGLNVEILSSSIQSLPRSAVHEAWGVYATADGKLQTTPVAGGN